MTDDASFLSRWSRLKRRVTLERKAPPDPSVAPRVAPGEMPRHPEENPVPDAAAPVSAEKPRAGEGPVDLSKLPPIESLGSSSDYSMFMRQGVPEELRMKALRRMWMTDPVLAGAEVLDMYAWDYTGVDGHKPLVRPVIEAVAAVAKTVQETVAETARKPEARDGVDGSSGSAAPQHDDARADEAQSTGPKTG